MKTRILAVLLLLALLLTACASGSELEKSGKEPKEMHRADETVNSVPDVDIGEVDGNTYRHVDLGFSVTFPEGWEIGKRRVVVAEEAGLINSVALDRAEVLDAVNEGQDVSIFAATDGSATVFLSVSLNPLPKADPNGDDFVNHFAPLIRQKYAAYDAWTLHSCEPYDVDFCGEDHVALKLSFGSGDTIIGEETRMYLPCGDLLYTLSVSSGSEDTNAEVLNYFEPLG